MIEKVICFVRALDQLKNELYSMTSEDSEKVDFDLNYHLVVRETAQRIAKRWEVPHNELYEGLIIDLLNKSRASAAGESVRLEAGSLERATKALECIAVQDYEDDKPAGAEWLGNKHDAHTLAAVLEHCACTARNALNDIEKE